MFVRVTGVDEELAEQLEEAAELYASLLMHGNLCNNLAVDININADIDFQAYCVHDDQLRFFTIDIRNAPTDDDIFKSLAHEMVHLKQYATKELSDIAIAYKGKVIDTAIWKGEVHKFKAKEDPYWDAPWEVEAYGREVGLYRRWLETQ
jgi:hypothetical protein